MPRSYGSSAGGLIGEMHAGVRPANRIALRELLIRLASPSSAKKVRAMPGNTAPPSGCKPQAERAHAEPALGGGPAMTRATSRRAHGRTSSEVAIRFSLESFDLAIRNGRLARVLDAAADRYHRAYIKSPTDGS
jgi:hypothetical protein